MIIHFSTLHSPQSTRIYHKYIKATNESLNFSAIYLCGGNSDLEFPDSVEKISDYSGGSLKSRLRNLFFGAKAIIAKRPEFVQLHDPELLVASPFFRLFSIKVIYDSHETLPSQFTSHNKKDRYLTPLIAFVENFFVKLFANHVIAATDEIYERFSSFHKEVHLIENGPRKKPSLIDFPKDLEFCYAGLIAPNRGIYELLEALEGEVLKIHICGPFASDEYKKKCLGTKFWAKNVIYHGTLTQEEVSELMKRSRYGIVSLVNTENYRDSRPTKLYEYLANSSKVVVSDIPYMRKAVIENQLGYTFDLNSPVDILSTFKKATNDTKGLNSDTLENFFNSVNFFDDQLSIFLCNLK